MSDEIEPLLTLLHLADSALPIGGYSHSWGMETWIQKETIHDFGTAEEAIRLLLVNSIASQDGIACGVAYRCARDQDFQKFNLLNEHLSAAKWPPEIYQASTRLGQRLLRLASETNFVASLKGLDQSKNIDGAVYSAEEIHHSAVFGWLAACAGVSERAAVSAFLQNSSNCLISSCVRLIPLGHTDGQRITVNLRPLIARLTEEASSKEMADMSAFAPLHEGACVAHENLYSRLFQS
ncbi:MAG: urease accessory protein UreF [Cyanobacteria bacterium REEB67]|nr:urease accessory protein UreF [Cyanobacteria bacterium REEB67]